MKNTSLLCAALLCTGALLSPSINAAPTTTGETFQYNPNKFQQVCRGKSAGDSVSMALNGVIFNGTCDVIFVPSGRTVSGLDDSALVQACQGKQRNDMASVPVNDQEIKGRCVLGFRAIEPTGTVTP